MHQSLSNPRLLLGDVPEQSLQRASTKEVA